MTGIFKGGAALTNLAIGSQQVKSVWLGGTLIWTPVAAPATSPVLVQQMATSYQGSATASKTFNKTATLGNTLLLTAVVRTGVSMPALTGWTLQNKVALSGSSVGNVAYYTRVSDGTETAVTYTWGSASTTNTFTVQEWQGAIVLGSVTAVSIPTSASPQAFGPSDAPPNANAVPSLLAVVVGAINTSGTVSVAAPWNTAASPTNGYAYAVAGTLPAPNAAVGGTLSYTANNTGVYYANCWITKP